jgi:hypothetical protein
LNFHGSPMTGPRRAGSNAVCPHEGETDPRGVGVLVVAQSVCGFAVTGTELLPIVSVGLVLEEILFAPHAFFHQRVPEFPAPCRA